MKIFKIDSAFVLSIAFILGFASCTLGKGGASKESNAGLYQFHSSVTILAPGTDGTGGKGGTYCYFGDWPQTLKSDDVIVDETKSISVGSQTYYLGSDNNYYARCTENAYFANCTYSNGEPVLKSSSSSQRYFRVEPIKWRMLNPGEDGNKILVAENILTADIPYYDYYNENRTIDGKTVYPNNYGHSKIRAYLNGLSYVVKNSDTEEQKTDGTYLNRGFLQTAFTESAQNLIALTDVDNSAESTNPDGDAKLWKEGQNVNACSDTRDKIFLLSEREATAADYGFAEYKDSGKHNSRIRKTTDYAKANYAYQDSSAEFGGWWWLRSPLYYGSDIARVVSHDGNASHYSHWFYRNVGIVPALTLVL